MNIKVITKDDKLVSLEEWQKLYGLSASPDQIGKYYFASEYIFARDLRDYGVLYVSELLIRVADAVRDKLGRAIHVNSFNRSEAKQKALTAEGLRTAEHSPHVVFLAMDMDTKSKAESLQLATIILNVARRLNIKVRVGYIQYANVGQTFVHFDVCPEYYGVGKPRHGTYHPTAWERAYSIW